MVTTEAECLETIKEVTKSDKNSSPVDIDEKSPPSSIQPKSMELQMSEQHSFDDAYGVEQDVKTFDEEVNNDLILAQSSPSTVTRKVGQSSAHSVARSKKTVSTHK